MFNKIFFVLVLFFIGINGVYAQTSADYENMSEKVNKIINDKFNELGRSPVNSRETYYQQLIVSYVKEGKIPMQTIKNLISFKAPNVADWNGITILTRMLGLRFADKEVNAKLKDGAKTFLDKLSKLSPESALKLISKVTPFYTTAANMCEVVENLLAEKGATITGRTKYYDIYLKNSKASLVTVIDLLKDHYPDIKEKIEHLLPLDKYASYKMAPLFVYMCNNGHTDAVRQTIDELCAYSKDGVMGLADLVAIREIRQLENNEAKSDAKNRLEYYTLGETGTDINDAELALMATAKIYGALIANETSPDRRNRALAVLILDGNIEFLEGAAIFSNTSDYVRVIGGFKDLVKEIKKSNTIDTSKPFKVDAVTNEKIENIITEMAKTKDIK